MELVGWLVGLLGDDVSNSARRHKKTGKRQNIDVFFSFYRYQRSF
jgi:hypothetical protein